MSRTYSKVPAYILFFLFALSQSSESIFTTGLPQISQEFSIDPNLAQLCSSIYFFGFAFGIFTLGRVSDHFGRKPVVIFGLSLFLFTCILSFFVNDIYHLIFLRFIQAFGASVGSVIAQAMARDSYQKDDLSKLYAGLAAGLAVMPAIGSLIGGNIVEYLGWRYNFLYLFAIVFVVFFVCIFRLFETNHHIGKSDTNKFWEVFRFMSRDKKLLCFAAIIGGFNGIMYSFYIEAPFIFIKKLNIHPSNYGFLILLLSFSGVAGSGISRYVQSLEMDGKKIIQMGIKLSVISCLIFVLLAFLWTYHYISDDFTKKFLIVPMLTQAMSFSIVMPLILRYSLEDYTKINGTAGSIFGAFYYMIVATINFITTRIHSETIIKFSLFFLFISLIIYKLNDICFRMKNNEISPYRARE